jgi:CDP-diacylglycerol--glycerol-3-phosphate 3-phosphatidyltransferase
MLAGAAARTLSSLHGLPDALTVSRLLMAPLLIVAAAVDRADVFLAALGYALLSDVVDGPISRALGRASAAGARLDSLADCAIYLSVPPAVLLLYSPIRDHETATVALIFAAYAAPISYGYGKYRRLTAYHTRAARMAAALLAVAFVVFLLTGVTWTLRVAGAALGLSALEEIAITRRLSEWRPDVPSLRSLDAAAPFRRRWRRPWPPSLPGWDRTAQAPARPRDGTSATVDRDDVRRAG